MPANVVSAWEDDPSSVSGIQPIDRPIPDLSQAPLSFTITGDFQPPADKYATGTPEFRYWTAAEALRRAGDFWSSVFQTAGVGATWEPGAPLPVVVDAGVDLNAFYDRQALNFFHDGGAATPVFSGESPDVVCHELGHAVLDAVRPELFDAHLDEVAAFHESFGDMSAILSALQLPSVRQALLAETQGQIDRSSHISRLAEQLGAAIRAIRADAVEADCLRNAANSFFYVDPQTLPPSGPASSLNSEPHNFSRVFTGAFLNGLATMLIASAGNNPTPDALLQVSADMGLLLIRAAQAAPVVPDYYSQVALQLVNQSQSVANGAYSSGLNGAFTQRGILSLQAASSLGDPGAQKAVAAAVPAYQSSTSVRPGESYGLMGARLLLDVPHGFRPFAAAAALDMGTADPHSHEASVHSFAEDLFRCGHVDTSAHAGPRRVIAHPTALKTHYLAQEAGGLRLRRRFFDCGFHAY